jgi:hypothetical protein
MNLTQFGVNKRTFDRLIYNNYVIEGVHYKRTYIISNSKTEIFDDKVDYVKEVVKRHCRSNYRRNF